MSLIHTCERAKASAFEYMRALMANPVAVAKAPADWMPWNYAASAAKLKAAAAPQTAGTTSAESRGWDHDMPRGGTPMPWPPGRAFLVDTHAHRKDTKEEADGQRLRTFL